MKKGDASIVATVILIISAIGIAVLVTTFSKQTEEKVSEQIITMGSSVECEDVRLSIDKFEDNKITLTNRGTLGIKSVYLRVFGDIVQTFPAKDFSTCLGESVKDGKLKPQKSCEMLILTGTNVYKIEVIPVIINDQKEEMGCENRISNWESSE